MTKIDSILFTEDKLLINRLLLFCLLFTCLNHAHAEDVDHYRLVVHKSLRELEVIKGDKVIDRFRIAHGKGGDGIKKIIGDKKTPVGSYKIIRLHQSNKFHYFMGLNYPNLMDAWYGYKNGLIDMDEFKAITTAIKNNNMPPQNTKLGGYIGLHGLGKTTKKKLSIHHEFNWTEGCIAMTNEQIEALKKYASLGTRVVIKE